MLNNSVSTQKDKEALISCSVDWEEEHDSLVLNQSFGDCTTTTVRQMMHREIEFIKERKSCARET